MEFYHFLSHLNMNQPQVYIYPLPSEPPPISFPIPPPNSSYKLPIEQ